MNPIARLGELGQSVWLDHVDHALLTSGELRRMIEEDGLRGVTSSPLMVNDLVIACDTLRGVYETTAGVDGFVSTEVDPTLAYDTAAQIDEATRLWKAVDRPNLMLRIPATRAGVPAIESCVRQGMNVDATLLFSVARYREVAGAHLRALERRLDMGEPLGRIASVASFFISGVDTEVDGLLDAMPNALRGSAGALRGEIAIATATLAYEEYEHILASERWRALAAAGARPQRLLWSSTAPKDPWYRDTYYVEPLVGRETVDAMTLETFRAYLDHGRPALRFETNAATAHKEMVALKELNVDLVQITDRLESEAVASLAESHRRARTPIAATRRDEAAAYPPA